MYSCLRQALEILTLLEDSDIDCVDTLNVIYLAWNEPILQNLLNETGTKSTNSEQFHPLSPPPPLHVLYQLPYPTMMSCWRRHHFADTVLSGNTAVVLLSHLVHFPLFLVGGGLWFCFVFSCQVPVLAIVVATLLGASLFSNFSSASSKVNSDSYTYSTDVCVDTANEGMWKVSSSMQYLKGALFDLFPMPWRDTVSKEGRVLYSTLWGLFSFF